MIKITFSPPTGDNAWVRWRADCEQELIRMQNLVANGGKPEVSKIYKRKTIKDKIYFATSGPFYGKCAYCETYVTEFQHPDIEHYRPKLRVTDENDEPIQVDYGNGPEVHRGYYWLAYSTDNLLPACEICNQPSTVASEKVGKHNRFPVEGAYARNEAEVAAEQPLLINPLVHDPETEIAVNIADGILTPRNGSKLGEATIKILGLNIRDRLRERRLAKITEVKSLAAKIVHGDGPAERLSVIAKLKKMKAGESEFAIAVRAVLADLKAIFGSEV